MVSKKRRNRWHGAIVRREPSGRPSRAVKGPAPAEIKRLESAALLGIADARWGTTLGRLALTRKIDFNMMVAGERWAALARRHQAVIGAPVLKPPSLELGSAGSPPDPESDAGQELATREHAIISDMEKAYTALCAAGTAAESIVRGCAEHDHNVAGFELEQLRKGLTALIGHWGLNDQKPR